MKIIELNRFVDTDGVSDTVPADAGCVDARMVADSACVPVGRPLFLPEFADNWELYMAPAVRVCRLGKFIGERFARRYYDAVTVVARLRPLDGGFAGACADSFDCSLMMGRWVELEPGCPLGLLSIRQDDGMETAVSPEALGIDRAVSLLSRWFTVRTGDIIIPGRTRLSRSPALNTRVMADLNGQRVVEFNVK